MNKLNKEQLQFILKINYLKKKKNALILVHNYQRPEIYEVADFIGDSLVLCEKAAKTTAEIIVFCGVNFMAESAVILNPKKKVLVPYLGAGCAMADMIGVRDLLKLKEKHPGAAVVTYVNSTAAIKAHSDIVCTSSNALAVVNSLKEKDIIFIPDKNLANYVQEHSPEKNIISFNACCPIHDFLDKEFLEDAKKSMPKAKVIAHPESKAEILKIADYVASTSGMIDVARKDKSKDFLVLTECGMTERLNKEVPNKNFHGLCNFCFDMKKNTLDSVYKCLLEEKFEVFVDEKIAKMAKNAFDRMFEVKKI